ncbi:uncharacterized protein STEHIDRAFT_120909 [Stereum hirsutum FP-91666 SS1]|uniref:uncharacterized protein n=1 Tax=Stereum hirsutum (strain FP-91666) TaxID=721885 RepID=UPI000440DCAF|nr:uncharacterized protein STEHIDRAFT_120909 [Stereum hirsutum FP-91666 SS1]EIM87210.1 hypothetical protein STEHIDRAFT_120909 [Stereum hirsutum FP-91666 SS1]
MRNRSSSVATQTQAPAGPSRSRSSTTSSPRPLPMVPSSEPSPPALLPSSTTQHAPIRPISLPVTRSDFQYYVPLSSKAENPEPHVDRNVTPARHSVFYFKDELSIFQVENTLYKVHRYFLQKGSPMFRTMFSYARRMGNRVGEGTKDSKPIILDGTTRKEFECLLSYLYDGVQDDFQMPPESWLSLLAISSRFKFSSIETRALSELFSLSPPLPPVLRISLANKHAESLPTEQREKYIHKAVKELVLHPQTLKPDEIDKIGSEVTAVVARAREDFVWEVCRTMTGDVTIWEGSVRLPTELRNGMGGNEARDWRKAVDGIVERVFSDLRAESAQ